MPYIKPEEKELLDKGSVPQTVGHLTYLYTKALISHEFTNLVWIELEEITSNWIWMKRASFTTFAQILGALTATEYEYNRRVHGDRDHASVVSEFINDFYYKTVAPYEDRKIAENGDVYAD